ncbi:hypothetical protein F5880DRAFT_1619219 [Lentinula raphanica]|nr:hypothetical protein F5880DRAFT_1619219 [Lentinula raphanica]
MPAGKGQKSTAFGGFLLKVALATSSSVIDKPSFKNEDGKRSVQTSVAYDLLAAMTIGFLQDRGLVSNRSILSLDESAEILVRAIKKTTENWSTEPDNCTQSRRPFHSNWPTSGFCDDSTLDITQRTLHNLESKLIYVGNFIKNEAASFPVDINLKESNISANTVDLWRRQHNRALGLQEAAGRGSIGLLVLPGKAFNDMPNTIDALEKRPGSKAPCIIRAVFSSCSDTYSPTYTLYSAEISFPARCTESLTELFEQCGTRDQGNWVFPSNTDCFIVERFGGKTKSPPVITRSVFRVESALPIGAHFTRSNLPVITQGLHEPTTRNGETHHHHWPLSELSADSHGLRSDHIDKTHQMGSGFNDERVHRVTVAASSVDSKCARPIEKFLDVISHNIRSMSTPRYNFTQSSIPGQGLTRPSIVTTTHSLQIFQLVTVMVCDIIIKHINSFGLYPTNAYAALSSQDLR